MTIGRRTDTIYEFNEVLLEREASKEPRMMPIRAPSSGGLRKLSDLTPEEYDKLRSELSQTSEPDKIKDIINDYKLNESIALPALMCHYKFETKLTSLGYDRSFSNIIIRNVIQENDLRNARYGNEKFLIENRVLFEAGLWSKIKNKIAKIGSAAQGLFMSEKGIDAANELRDIILNSTSEAFNKFFEEFISQYPEYPNMESADEFNSATLEFIILYDKLKNELKDGANDSSGVPLTVEAANVIVEKLKELLQHFYKKLSFVYRVAESRRHGGRHMFESFAAASAALGFLGIGLSIVDPDATVMGVLNNIKSSRAKKMKDIINKLDEFPVTEESEQAFKQTLASVAQQVAPSKGKEKPASASEIGKFDPLAYAYMGDDEDTNTGKNEKDVLAQLERPGARTERVPLKKLTDDELQDFSLEFRTAIFDYNTKRKASGAAARKQRAAYDRDTKEIIRSWGLAEHNKRKRVMTEQFNDSEDMLIDTHRWDVLVEGKE